MNDPEKSSTISGSKARPANGNAAEETSSTEIYRGQVDDLHDLFGSTVALEGADEEDPLAQLRNDPNYAALIRDLEYIATQARLLFAPADEVPSDEVWTKIQHQLGAKDAEK